MRITFLIFLLSFLAISSAAQESKCSLELSNAPTLLGLRLEMSPDEVRGVFGGKLKIKVKKEGTFFQNYIEKKPPPSLPNVRALYLRFFDRKLYQIEIFYELQNKRQTLEEFITEFSARLNLPTDLWTKKHGTAEINCAAFSLTADNVLNPRIELTDKPIRTRFEDSQKKNKK